jgi:hypothetical protein
MRPDVASQRTLGQAARLLSSAGTQHGTRMAPMDNVVAMGHHTGIRLAEVGFLLIVFAGVWLAAAQIPRLKLGTARTIVGSIALAIGGVLLIIATHWGHFG